VDLRHPRVKRVAALLATLGLLGALAISPASVSAEKYSMVTRYALGKVDAAVINTESGIKVMPAISGAAMAAARFAAIDIQEERNVAADAAEGQVESDQFAVTSGSLGCRKRNSDGNVRVNQDCTFRRQAEESIKINPADRDNIIAGQNDSRIGYNKCGFDYSFDGGKTWGDGLPPTFQKENRPQNDVPNANNPNRNTILATPGTLHTYDAGSDPAVAFDS